jgi:hypothetical protein
MINSVHFVGTTIAANSSFYIIESQNSILR